MSGIFATISRKLMLVAIIATISLGSIVIGWWSIFDRLKVNGHTYTEIIKMKDLLADILPPPEYIIESYLTAYQAMYDEKVDLGALEGRMKALKGEYDDRHKYWTEQTLPDDIKSLILEKSYEPSIRFYKVALEQFFPALKKGDRETAKKAFAALVREYDSHREQIDALVKASVEEASRIEADASVAEKLSKETMVAASILLAAILLAAMLLVSRNITRPIRGLIGAVEALGKGNLDQTIPGTERKDEIGPLAMAIEQGRIAQLEAVAKQAEEQKSMEARLARQERVEKATANFEGTIAELLSTIKQASERLHGSADTLTRNAEQTQSQSAAVSSATEQATANVETVASASSELSASIGEISSQVQNSATMTKAAVGEAEEVNRKVEGLADAGQRIGEVLKLIEDIAAQTNLLALNATIEAARAGEAVKGFAVVATEVKNLASQTASATEEISKQIETVQTETHDAVASIKSITGTILRIDELAATIASAVEEQGAATSEIARNVEEASKGTAEVATNISDVAAIAAETGEMAKSVLDAAKELLERSAGLDRSVGSFLSEVRSA